MVALARALAAQGHTAVFATGRELCPEISALGFRAIPAGLDDVAAVAENMRQHPALEQMPPHLGWQRGNALFAKVAAEAMVGDLVPILAELRPALVVHETAEFGGPLAAAVAGIPWVHHSWGPLRPRHMSRHAGDLVAPLWREWGLEPDAFGGHFRFLYLDICPPGFQTSQAAAIDVRHLLRPVVFSGTDGDALPEWFAALPPRPLVYVTFGTVFNRDLCLFEAVLEGLENEPVNVVVTVGRNNDPAALRTVGAPARRNVHIERYIGHAALLPHCDLAVTHGGSATTLGALDHGVPLLVLPQGADQFRNAERTVASGVGRRLLGAEATPAAVRREVRTLLSDETYRGRARAIRDEVALMPPPSERVVLLDQLARERAPLTAPSAP